MKQRIDSPAVREKVDADEARSRREGTSDVHSALNHSLEEDNTRFIRDQRQTTKQVIRQQDDSLVELGNAVDRLHAVGKEINTEVKEQNILLDELGNEIDTASTRMEAVQEILGKLLRTKDGCQIWTIVILCLILVLLGQKFFSSYHLHLLSLNNKFVVKIIVALVIWT